MRIWEEEEGLVEANNISVAYGSVKALQGVSFTVNPGEIVALIGPNGAGKSTALKAVFGMIEMTSGDILIEKENIRGLRPDQLVAKHVSLIPEGRHLFPSMTVIENLEIGAFQGSDNQRKVEIERILDIFPLLWEKRRSKAGTLSTGEQQIVAIGRALMQRPKLLLADEPSLGLSPPYAELVFDKLVSINKSGTSILLVEQNAHMALEIAHRGYMLRQGTVLLEGKGMIMLQNPEVKKAFLGG